MGKLLTLPVKIRRTRSRKWSLPAFQQRARQTQEAIQAASAALINDYKLLKWKKRVDYQSYAKILQTVRELRQRNDTWSATMYNDEHLPSVVYILRYPLLSACYHVQQHADELITLLMAACTAYSTSPIEETRLHQDIVKALASLLKSGKEVSCEITALLDQIRFREQRCVI